MNKTFLRIIAVLLLPVLLLQDVSAISLTLIPSPIRTSERERVGVRATFESQAVSAALDWVRASYSNTSWQVRQWGFARMAVGAGRLGRRFWHSTVTLLESIRSDGLHWLVLSNAVLFAVLQAREGVPPLALGLDWERYGLPAVSHGTMGLMFLAAVFTWARAINFSPVKKNGVPIIDSRHIRRAAFLAAGAALFFQAALWALPGFVSGQELDGITAYRSTLRNEKTLHALGPLPPEFHTGLRIVFVPKDELLSRVSPEQKNVAGVYERQTHSTEVLDTLMDGNLVQSTVHEEGHDWVTRHIDGETKRRLTLWHDMTLGSRDFEHLISWYAQTGITEKTQQEMEDLQKKSPDEWLELVAGKTKSAVRWEEAFAETFATWFCAPNKLFLTPGVDRSLPVQKFIEAVSQAYIFEKDGKRVIRFYRPARYVALNGTELPVYVDRPIHGPLNYPDLKALYAQAYPYVEPAPPQFTLPSPSTKTVGTPKSGSMVSRGIRQSERRGAALQTPLFFIAILALTISELLLWARFGHPFGWPLFIAVNVAIGLGAIVLGATTTALLVPFLLHGGYRVAGTLGMMRWLAVVVTLIMGVTTPLLMARRSKEISDQARMHRFWLDEWSQYDGDAFFAPDGQAIEFWERFFLEIDPTSRMLDIGTGQFALPRLARDISKSFEIHAIDYATQVSPGRVPEGVQFSRQNTENLRYPDNFFDVVTAQFALEYADTARAMSEAFRVLKPGGIGAFVLHHPQSRLSKLMAVEIAATEAVLATGIFPALRAFLRLDSVPNETAFGIAKYRLEELPESITGREVLDVVEAALDQGLPRMVSDTEKILLRRLDFMKLFLRDVVAQVPANIHGASLWMAGYGFIVESTELLAGMRGIYGWGFLVKKPSGTNPGTPPRTGVRGAIEPVFAPPTEESGRLILVRHGLTGHNLKGIFTGTVDVPVSPEGLEQSLRAGHLLRAHGIRPDVTVAAQLRRTRDSAAKILEGLGMTDQPVLVFPELNERDYGSLQGKTHAAAEEIYGTEQVQKWRRSLAARPPNGESLQDVVERRVQPWIQNVLIPWMAEGKTVLISGSGNIVRAMEMVLEELMDEEILHREIDWAVPIIYRLTAEGRVLEKTELHLPAVDKDNKSSHETRGFTRVPWPWWLTMLAFPLFMVLGGGAGGVPSSDGKSAENADEKVLKDGVMAYMQAVIDQSDALEAEIAKALAATGPFTVRLGRGGLVWFGMARGMDIQILLPGKLLDGPPTIQPVLQDGELTLHVSAKIIDGRSRTWIFEFNRISGLVEKSLVRPWQRRRWVKIQPAGEEPVPPATPLPIPTQEALKKPGSEFEVQNIFTPIQHEPLLEPHSTLPEIQAGLQHLRTLGYTDTTIAGKASIALKTVVSVADGKTTAILPRTAAAIVNAYTALVQGVPELSVLKEAFDELKDLGYDVRRIAEPTGHYHVALGAAAGTATLLSAPIRRDLWAAIEAARVQAAGVPTVAALIEKTDELYARGFTQNDLSDESMVEASKITQIRKGKVKNPPPEIRLALWQALKRMAKQKTPQERRALLIRRMNKALTRFSPEEVARASGVRDTGTIQRLVRGVQAPVKKEKDLSRGIDALLRRDAWAASLSKLYDFPDIWAETLEQGPSETRWARFLEKIRQRAPKLTAEFEKIPVQAVAIGFSELLIYKPAQRAVLIAGRSVAGKSSLAAHLAGDPASQWQRADPDSNWTYIGGDNVLTFLVNGQLLAGPWLRSPWDQLHLLWGDGFSAFPALPQVVPLDAAVYLDAAENKHMLRQAFLKMFFIYEAGHPLTELKAIMACLPMHAVSDSRRILDFHESCLAWVRDVTFWMNTHAYPALRARHALQAAA